ncbi:hypothetical protein [Nitrospira sp.]|uniref:hypothetical protein n=1 Tax=Nitrospira sp. TaxID=70125 RepID=UPI003FCE20C5
MNESRRSIEIDPHVIITREGLADNPSVLHVGLCGHHAQALQYVPVETSASLDD